VYNIVIIVTRLGPYIIMLSCIILLCVFYRTRKPYGFRPYFFSPESQQKLGRTFFLMLLRPSRRANTMKIYYNIMHTTHAYNNNNTYIYMRKHLMVTLSATLTTFQCRVEHALWLPIVRSYVIYYIVCRVMHYCMRMCSGDNVTKYGDGGGHPRREDRVGLQCLWV